MKNKASILNILLAAIIVALTFQLSFRSKEVEAPKEEKKQSEHKHSKMKHEQTPNDKISVGIQNYLMPQPAVVIGTYAEDGMPNIMTAAWVGTSSSRPLTIAVSLRPATMSHGNILRNKSFTINIPSVKQAPMMDYVGVISGRDENKFQKLGLTPVESQLVKAPYVQEFPISIECELIDTLTIGSHMQFIGQVKDTKVAAQFLNADGSLDLIALQPLLFQENMYYSFGIPVAKSRDAYKVFVDDKEPQFTPKTYESATIGIIHERKSVRNFTDRQVSKEQLETLARAGMAAPTAVNKQPWAFVAINERAMLDKLCTALPRAKMLEAATAAMVVCGDMNKALEGKGQEYWIQDCSAATQNILLAAESLGLGAVWTGVYPMEDRVQAVKDILNMPEHLTPLCVIPIGYPTGVDQPKDKWKPENLIWHVE
ncbi:MAG: flavin reductase [Mangrovibacterium sp.]